MKFFGKNNYLAKEKYGMGKDELVNIQNEMLTRPYIMMHTNFMINI